MHFLIMKNINKNEVTFNKEVKILKLQIKENVQQSCLEVF